MAPGGTSGGQNNHARLFRDEYNEVMTRARLKCEAERLPYEVILL